MITRYDVRTESTLKETPFAADSLYYCSDTGNIFFDSPATQQRIPLGVDILFVDNKDALPLAPIPNKLYFIKDTGRITLYTDGNWNEVQPETQFVIKNVVISSEAALVLNDTRIHAIDSATFIPISELVDIHNNYPSTCTCEEGSVSVTTASVYPIFGDVYINYTKRED